MASPHTDAEGRRRDVPLGHRIGYLVLCRGLPLKISEPAPQGLKVHRASVDAEFALMAHPAYARAGAVKNPLFDRLDPPATVLGKVIKVARLDGPDLAGVRGLIEGALSVEARARLRRSREGLTLRATIGSKRRHTIWKSWALTSRSRRVGS